MKKILLIILLLAVVGGVIYWSVQNNKLVRGSTQLADTGRGYVNVGTTEIIGGTRLGGGGETGDFTYTSDTTGGRDSTTPQQVGGCRNKLACNYNKDATADSGTCEYKFLQQGVNGNTLGNPPALENTLRQRNPDDSTVTIKPKASCSANEAAGCVQMAISSWSAPASQLFPAGRFNPTLTPVGFVTTVTAGTATARKACDPIVVRDASGATVKVR